MLSLVTQYRQTSILLLRLPGKWEKHLPMILSLKSCQTMLDSIECTIKVNYLQIGALHRNWLKTKFKVSNLETLTDSHGQMAASEAVPLVRLILG